MVLKTHIDYYSGTAYLKNLEECEEFCHKLADLLETPDEVTIEKRDRMLGEKFNYAVDSVWGMFGAYRPTADKAKLAVQLPGEFCRKMQDQETAIKFLWENTHPTRIDLALDDDKRRISQKALNRIANLGHYKGVNSYKFIESKACQDGEQGGTCQFGKSEKVIRYYNAEIVHNLPADRWELQARGDRACQIVSILSTNNVKDYAGAIVTGSIDFVIRGKTWRHEKRYEFWEQLKEETMSPMGEIEISPASTTRSIDKSMRWLRHQVGPLLKILYQSYGRQNYLTLMESIATDPHIKLKPQQESWINYLRRANEPLTP